MSKIREIAIEAGMISREYNGFDRCSLDADELRFAELLIKECCKALHPQLRDMISRGQGVDLIKEHFGVK
jgi:hypothetical protein